MKYIVFRQQMGEGLAREIPVIFPNELVHASVAEGLQRAIMETTGRKDILPEIVAAGECNRVDCDCTGGSETLGVDSRYSVDERLISTHDYFHGIEMT